MSFPTCLKGTRSSMCVQISVTAGEFPCLRGPLAGKSDKVCENCIRTMSAVKVCFNCWEIHPSIYPCSIAASSGSLEPPLSCHLGEGSRAVHPRATENDKQSFAFAPTLPSLSQLSVVGS